MGDRWEVPCPQRTFVLRTTTKTRFPECGVSCHSWLAGRVLVADDRIHKWRVRVTFHAVNCEAQVGRAGRTQQGEQPHMHEITDDERPGLQALLRGAAECAALLPEDSWRRQAAIDLAADLSRLLADGPQRSPGRVVGSGPRFRRGPHHLA